MIDDFDFDEDPHVAEWMDDFTLKQAALFIIIGKTSASKNPEESATLVSYLMESQTKKQQIALGKLGNQNSAHFLGIFSNRVVTNYDSMFAPEYREEISEHIRYYGDKVLNHHGK